ncbi:MAG: 2-C-methyl-D-erythritol 4-phosphate cytidylyltransferase [Halanaerobium sp. MSAO_Bac5]|nr:MAG: 2-C-methyl-D-erythritol 4-phosphate cytidylyltransferase [Halanaerobium sp. MSAO_Bac5]
MNKVGVVIAAAGQGKRMGHNINKQFLPLLGKPILYYTIKAFADWGKAAEIVIVLNNKEIDYFKKKIKALFSYSAQKNLSLVSGGKSRKESVYNGISSLNDNISYVLIHDGARPLIKKSLIESTYQAVKKHKAVSCGVKVKDTITLVEDSISQQTLNRDKLRAIQTPQAFELDLIKKAHHSYDKDKALDDASLVELLGKKVYIVDGDYNNLKITTAEDLKPAEVILKERR